MCNECETPEEDAQCPRTLDTFESYTDFEILTLAGLDDHMIEWMAKQEPIHRHNEFLDKRCPVVLH